MDLDLDLVTVEVGSGETKQTFHLNKTLLTTQSSYFRAVFDGKFLEAQQRSLTLNETDPKLFECVLRFLESGTITSAMREIDTREHVRVQIPKVSNAIMEELRALPSEELTPKWLNCVFEKETDATVPIIACWKAYAARFWPRERLPAPRFIKSIPQTFGDKVQENLRVHPGSGQTIKGIRPRDRVVDLSGHTVDEDANSFLTRNIREWLSIPQNEALKLEYVTAVSGDAHYERAMAASERLRNSTVFYAHFMSALEELQKGVLRYIELWKLADYLAIPKLCNLIIHRLFHLFERPMDCDACLVQPRGAEYNCLKFVDACYESTQPNGPLRKWIAGIFASGVASLSPHGPDGGEYEDAVYAVDTLEHGTAFLFDVQWQREMMESEERSEGIIPILSKCQCRTMFLRPKVQGLLLEES